MVIEDFFLGSVLVFLVALMTAAPFAIAYECRRMDHFRKECLADGHKSYECEALLRDHR